MSLTENLKNNNIDLWNRTHLNHPFVQSMKNGTLDFKNFKLGFFHTWRGAIVNWFILFWVNTNVFSRVNW